MESAKRVDFTLFDLLNSNKVNDWKESRNLANWKINIVQAQIKGPALRNSNISNTPRFRELGLREIRTPGWFEMEMSPVRNDTHKKGTTGFEKKNSKKVSTYLEFLVA